MGSNPITYLSFGIVLILMLGMPCVVVALYRDHKGISRPQYFGCFVVFCIGILITNALLESKSLEVPAGIVGLLSLYLILAATVRRLTDAGWNPWLTYVAVLPLISFVFFVVLFFVPQKNSDAEINQENPSPTTQGQVFFVPQTKTDTGKQSIHANPDRARSLMPKDIGRTEGSDRRKTEDLMQNSIINLKQTEAVKAQDMNLLAICRNNSNAKDILKGLERMGSKVGIIDLPLNEKARDRLLRVVSKVTRKSLLQEYAFLVGSNPNDWSQEFEILFEYDSVVKDCHDSLNELDLQLSSQFRQEVVKDRKQAKSIHDRLLAAHDKKLNPYDSGDLNQAYSEARKLGPSAEDEFVRVIDVMGEDIDIESILGKLKEKYS